MHELIASPFLGDHLVLRPGSARGLRIAETRFRELQRTPAGDPVPGWLADAVGRCWGLELAGRGPGRCWSGRSRGTGTAAPPTS